MRNGSFRDPGLSLEERVAALLGELTLDEKIGLLHQRQAAVPRLGIAAFRTGTEALHGLAWLGPATVFPQAIGLASTWNPDLVRAVGAAVGDEVRGLHHKDPTRLGLNVWAPVVNLLRDPRWGRNEEGYAEDPWLTGTMAVAYARGLSGDHPTYLKTAPTLKHFLGYNNETDRSTTSSNLPPRVLHEYELPAFRAPVAAGAAVAVMASYNLVNGRPATLSPLIGDELRRWCGQEIMLVGDAGVVDNLTTAQRWCPDHVTGLAAALRAGIDNVTEDADSAPTIDRTVEALRRGLLDESDIDRAVRRILTLRFRLGEFDPPERNPHTTITADVINCTEHQRLAREAARQSIVLLRNEDGLLPLEPGRVRRVAVLGPLADTVHEDWYSGTLPYAVSALDGLAAHLGDPHPRFHSGADRIALRAEAGWVTATDRPDGAPLRLRPAREGATAGGPETWFDVYDWGQETIVLRAVANGRHVGVTDDALVSRLVNDRPGPGGWVVRETFRLVERVDGRTVLHHLATGRYVSADPDGMLRADAATAEQATGFTVETVIDGVGAAAALARDADVAVVVVGNHPMVGGRETEDRVDLALPTRQEALVRAVHAANPRTVLVVASSYPFALGWADAHVPAIVWSAHGGQEYGNALAAVLCGAAEPGGRLTQTWYRDTADLPDLLDYDVIANDATYLYYRGTPLYPFGHGLSYTTFDYSELRLSADSVTADGEVEVRVRVRNTGPRPGEDVVQLYTRQRRSRVKQPLRQLRDFARVALAPGEETTVRLRLAAADLTHWDVTRNRYVVEDAPHTVAVGRSCTDLVLTATLRVRGEAIGPRRLLAGRLHAISHDEYADVVPVADGPTDTAVAAATGDAWLRFAGVDFGDAQAGRPGGGPPGAGNEHVAGFTARVTAATTLTLRLDDPLTGPVIGAVTAPAGIDDAPPDPAAQSTAKRHKWHEISAPLAGPVNGIRDLYLVFGAVGATVSWLTFVPAEGPPSAAGRGGL